MLQESDIPIVLIVGMQAYNYPVDIEFTINGSPDGQFVFNLLQCRPLQAGTHRDTVTVPELPEANTIFSVTDSSMGGSRAEQIDYIVWIDSKGYYQCPYKKKRTSPALLAISITILEKATKDLCYSFLEESESLPQN